MFIALGLLLPIGAAAQNDVEDVIAREKLAIERKAALDRKKKEIDNVQADIDEIKASIREYDRKMGAL